MENQPQGEAHPALQNAVVLQSIFEQLSLLSSPSTIREETGNFRLVCRSWRDASRGQFQRLQPTVLFDGCSTHSTAGKSLGEFLGLMQKSSFIPYQSYKFSTSSFRGCGAYPLFTEFLSSCGHTVVNLQLELTLGQLRLIQLEGLVDLKLDRLRKLRIEILAHDEQDISAAGFVTPIGMLLGAAENATSFRLHYMKGGRELKGHRPLVESQLVRTICRQLPASVVELSFFGVLLDRRGARLLSRTTGLALERLGFYCRPTMEIGEEVQAFLDSQAKSLQLCAIRGCSEGDEEGTGDFILTMPSMPKLVHLQLYGLSVAPFSFPSKLPLLSILDTDEWGKFPHRLLETMGVTVARTTTTTNPTTTILQELHIRLYSSTAVQLVQPISKTFSSLSVLYLFNRSSLNNLVGTLQRVFSLLTSIQHLRIDMGGGHQEQTFSLDALLTGLEEGRCRELRWMEDTAAMKAMNAAQGVSLLNLKGLKRLDLESPIARRGVRYILTDVTARLVFLRLEQLEELSLFSGAFSVPVFERLRDQVTRLECYEGQASLIEGPDYPPPADREDLH